MIVGGDITPMETMADLTPVQPINPIVTPVPNKSKVLESLPDIHQDKTRNLDYKTLEVRKMSQMSQYSDIKEMIAKNEYAARKFSSKSYLDNYTPISTVKVRALSKRKSTDIDAIAGMGYHITHENNKF